MLPIVYRLPARRRGTLGGVFSGTETTNRILTKLNENALNDNRVCIKNQDAYKFLLNDDSIFDVIIIDFPDPKTVGLARLYTRQFYKLVIRHLTPGGVMVTQATSPFFSKQAFLSILKTMRSIGIPAIAYHNHIPTMGEWGWALGINAPGLKHSALKKRLSVMSFENVSTRFINQEAMQSMLNFGKGTLDKLYKVEVNDNLNMYIYNYYKKGSWDMY